MKNDDPIQAGFAALRTAQPSRDASDLVRTMRRRSVRAKVLKLAIAATGGISALVALGISLKPTVALAALSAAERLSSAQPVVHLHFETETTPAQPTATPEAQTPPLDIWRFPDHYFRKQGHVLSELYPNGKILAYDDRFPFGFRSAYDALHDRFWGFDGTIAIEMTGAHRDPPKVREVTYQGRKMTDYEWDDIDGMQNRKVGHTFVDPRTNLVRFGASAEVSSTGDQSNSTTSVDYPTVSEAERHAPNFPSGTRFLRPYDLKTEFDAKIRRPDQTKVIDGIPVSLYGVILFPIGQDGIAAQAVTRGGAEPGFGSGHPLTILSPNLLSVKDSAWFGILNFPENSKSEWPQVIGTEKYLVSTSVNLLTQAPSRITVRVPVWRLNLSQGQPRFVGYATFTTSKLFYEVDAADWSFIPGPGAGGPEGPGAPAPAGGPGG